MSTAAPTFSQIRAQVATIRRKVPDARVIGIFAQGRWTGERMRSDGGETYCIAQCDSPLQVRIALQEQLPEPATKVLVTGLADQELGEDVLVRLAKRRLFPIDSWQIVKSLFQARSVDPRLAQHPWIAERLFDLIPSEGYPPVPGGFLDAETVWPILLASIIGFPAQRPDLQSLLKWSTDPEGVRRFRQAPETFRTAAQDWLVQLAGPAAEAILHCVLSSERPDALPVGLAVGVVYAPQAAGKLDKAAGRLEERFLGGKSPEEPLIQRWHAAATEVACLQITDGKARRAQLQRADDILVEVQADAYAYLSSTSPLGFNQRLARFGSAMSGLLQSHAISSLDSITESQQSAQQHEQARSEARRIQRLEMSVRLVRWLKQRSESGDPQPASFAHAAQRQLAEGSFVDWARYSLRSGDPVRELSEAYAQLGERVTAIREAQNRKFAELLRDWTAAGSTGGDIIPVERFLDEILAPLAAQVPVLLVVVDGMSAAVSRELVGDIVRQGWVPLCEESYAVTRPALATIPSVTEVSRTSLLCGKLTQGTASTEALGFAEHRGLLAHCRAGRPPILFHKVSLQDDEDTSLSASIRKEIGSSQRRIVGVVINAVDDYLLKGQQLDIQWTRDEIKTFATLLHEARSAGRVVVLVSDHGHILDHGTQMGPVEACERWRPAVGSPDDNELLISGSRVLLAENGRLISPWSEKVRYSKGTRNGYHGGLTPQEMVIPITVLTAAHKVPTGWTEATVDTPDWWEAQVTPTPADDVPGKTQPAKKKDNGFLFPIDEEPVDEPANPEPVAGVSPATWLKALKASPLLDEQKKRAGRAVPADEVLFGLLGALDSRGGKLTSTALAKTLHVPPFRLRGLLAVAQRMLNIDGFPVLTRDEASDTIELNRELLLKQFDLSEK